MKFCALVICCVLSSQNVVIGKRAPERRENHDRNNRNHSVNFESQSTEIQDVSTATFSAKLYEAARENQPPNFVLSPLSLRNVLVLLNIGAADETANEIRQSLKLPNDRDTLINGQSQLISSLNNISSQNSGVKFVSADKIYVKSKLRIKSEFKNAVQKLQAEIENVNFENSEAAAEKINTWVKGKTEGKIEKVVESGSLNGQTSLFVLNTIYFKGLWKNQFPPSNTRKQPFFVGGNKKMMVDTMTQENEFAFAYLQEANAKVIVLPYQGERLSMMIYLPNEKSSLDNLENWLKNQSAFEIQEQHLNKDQIQSVTVSLPKFKIRSSLQLNEPLKSLGLSRIFDVHTANFTNMFHSARNLFVSKISQETFLEVNEEGTEAAAATDADVVATSIGSQFRINRPFLFQIVDNTTKTVLFTGRVKNPSENPNSVDSSLPEDPTAEVEESAANHSEGDENTSKNNANTGRNPALENSAEKTTDAFESHQTGMQTLEQHQSKITQKELENNPVQKTETVSESEFEAEHVTRHRKQNKNNYNHKN